MIGIEWRTTHKNYKDLANEFKNMRGKKTSYLYMLGKVTALELNALKLGVKL